VDLSALPDGRGRRADRAVLEGQGGNGGAGAPHVLAPSNPSSSRRVGTFRSGGRSDGPLVETLGALPRDATVTRIAPHGLTASQTVTLIKATAGHGEDDAGEDLGEFLHRQTDGNPFYLVEMLSHLRETGVISAVRDGRRTTRVDVSAVGLPDSIRDVLRARVALLGSDTARILSEAAVIG
jgi:hypothetical protein